MSRSDGKATELWPGPEDQDFYIGLNIWVNGLETRSFGGADVANGFIFSQKFINRNTSNEDFVQILYRAFFGRESDTEGYEGWVNYLYSGGTRQDVLDGFIYS